MKTEKRQAEPGERIVFTNARSPKDEYENGDIRPVWARAAKEDFHILVDWVTHPVYMDEYEVIIEEDE